MTKVKFIASQQNLVDTGAKQAGQIVFTFDTCDIYWDVSDDIRIKMTDIVELADDESRSSLVNPVNKFYYVFSTNAFWRFHNGNWTQINVTRETNSIDLISSDADNALEVGSDGKLFLNANSSDGVTELGTVFSISVNDWVVSNRFENYPFQVNIHSANVAEDDLVRIQFDAKSTIEANWAHILSSGEVLSNNVILYSKKIPRIPLSGLLSIVRSDE